MILPGKVAVITGGGRGIGKAAALRMSAEGADVVIVSRTPKELEEAKSEISRGGSRVRAFALDVSDKTAVQSMVDETVKEFGRIDILVNSAGVLDFFPIAEVSPQQFDAIFDVNVKGAMYTTQAVLPVMKKQKTGNVVMVSAIGAFGGGGIAPVYRASKAALNSIAEAFAEATLGTGIRVNTVCPSEVRTRMSASMKVVTSDKRGWMEPEEIADIILFLASDQSRAMTGATLIARGQLKLSRWG